MAPKMNTSAEDGEPDIQIEVPDAQGVQIGDCNTQENKYIGTYIESQVLQVPSVPVHMTVGILTHREEVAGLSGLRRNLLGEFLPFVPPGGQDETHPDQLFSQLSGMDSAGGVLLVGAAGAGKTRTCFEVADRAATDGWAVLHVTPGEPLVSTDQLGDAIGTAGGKVLVIIDYLNDCQGLDLLALRSVFFQTLDVKECGSRCWLPRGQAGNFSPMQI